jgi:hypothetical protein
MPRRSFFVVKNMVFCGEIRGGFVVICVVDLTALFLVHW